MILVDDGAGAYAAPVPGALPLDPSCEEEGFLYILLSACCLGNGEAGACAAPVPGALPLNPFCDTEGCFSRRLSACCLDNEGNEGAEPTDMGWRYQ